MDSFVTVLLIDPHEGERQNWAESLKYCSSEYVVLEAQSGKAGLAICASRPVDCVVTELTLPDISGFEVLITLVPVAGSPKIAVVVLTRQVYHPMRDVAFRTALKPTWSKLEVPDTISTKPSARQLRSSVQRNNSRKWQVSIPQLHARQPDASPWGHLPPVRSADMRL